MRSQFVLQEIWIGLRRNLTMTMALIVVVAISLSLLGTGLLFVKQVDRTRTYWQGKVELSIYLCIKTSPQPQCQSNGPATEAEKSALQQRLKAMPQVETVVDEMTILDKFYKLLDGARNAVLIIALILIVAAVLLVANTIRLSAFNRRRETAIMRLVGASNFYIQLPFLLEGAIAGLIGWAIAAGLLVAVKSLMLDSLEQYFSFNVGLSVADLVEVILFSMVVGVVLCGATSFLTLRRYLRI